MERLFRVDRYKSLADIERSFRVLNSDIEVAPVYRRLPDRIRARAVDFLHGLQEADAETAAA